MSVTVKLIIESIIAFLIRLWLVTSEYKRSISDRVEISTPLNSWKRVTESVHLLNENIDPYIGDLIHEPPINLYVYKYFIQYSQEYLPCIFILADILTAYFLYLTAKKYLVLSYKQQCAILRENEKCAKKIETGGDGDKKDENSSHEDKLFLTETSIKLTPIYVFTAYLFNPYVIFNCVAMTTTVFNNLFLGIYLCLLVHKRIFLCCLALAVSATPTLYSATMIVPILLNSNDKGKINKFKVLIYALIFFFFVAGFQYISYLLSGSMNYVENTYGTILLILDLKPNIGLFWYLFTEIFDHFRELFIFTYFINATFLYLIPLSITFRKDPLLLATSLIMLTTIFKTYPNLGDIGFCLSQVPIWAHVFCFSDLQQGFYVLCFFFMTVLDPIMWHLWIYSRSANANFYFGFTLSLGAAQILFIIDLLLAYLKSDFWLKFNHLRNTVSEKAKFTLEY